MPPLTLGILTGVTARLARFDGFGSRAVSFWHDLEADNSKAFFDSERETYERDIREPLERLLGEVAQEFGDGKVFRPNRDVRFAKDKSPYKLSASALVGAEEGAVYYVQVGADGLLTASGYHQMSPAQTRRFYEAVDDDDTGAQLETLVEAARSAGATVGGSQLKTAPRGYSADHPRVALLRHKGLTLSRAWPEHNWLHTREVLRRVTGLWRESADVNAWLTRHVGPDREAQTYG